MKEQDKFVKIKKENIGKKKNNAIAQKFLEAGYEICKPDEKMDIAIVNTCTVTNIADRKSRQMLRKIKDENKEAIVVAVRVLCSSCKRWSW